ncbi:MAG: hypothetical protein WBQ05_09280 [Candidatus Competibacter denitrificans]
MSSLDSPDLPDWMLLGERADMLALLSHTSLCPSQWPEAADALIAWKYQGIALDAPDSVGGISKPVWDSMTEEARQRFLQAQRDNDEALMKALRSGAAMLPSVEAST